MQNSIKDDSELFGISDIVDEDAASVSDMTPVPDSGAGFEKTPGNKPTTQVLNAPVCSLISMRAPN